MADTEDAIARLVEGAAAGDRQAWDALVTRYAGLVWSITRSYRLSEADAADVAQSVWLRLVENLPSIRDPHRLPGWIATTTRREALHALRTLARSRPVDSLPQEPVDRTAPARDTPGEALIAAGEQEAVWRAFRRLPQPCQRLLRVFAAEPALSYAEMSAVLGAPIGSIGPTRSRCLHRLRGYLAEEAGSDEELMRSLRERLRTVPEQPDGPAPAQG